MLVSFVGTALCCCYAWFPCCLRQVCCDAGHAVPQPIRPRAQGAHGVPGQAGSSSNSGNSGSRANDRGCCKGPLPAAAAAAAGASRSARHTIRAPSAPFAAQCASAGCVPGGQRRATHATHTRLSHQCCTSPVNTAAATHTPTSSLRCSWWRHQQQVQAGQQHHRWDRAAAPAPTKSAAHADGA